MCFKILSDDSEEDISGRREKRDQSSPDCWVCPGAEEMYGQACDWGGVGAARGVAFRDQPQVPPYWKTVWDNNLPPWALLSPSPGFQF